MITRILIIFVITESATSDNKFMTAVRNLTTSSGYNSPRNQTNVESDGENALKNEISKYLKECNGSDDFSDERDHHSRDNRDYNKRNDGDGKVYPDYRQGGSDYYRYQKTSQGRNQNDDNIDGYLTSYGNNRNNNKQKNSYSENYDHKGNSDDDRYDRRNVDASSSRPSGSDYNYYGKQSGANDRPRETFAVTRSESNPYDMNKYNYQPNGDGQSYSSSNPYYRFGDYGGYNLNSRESYPTNGDLVRWKRGSENCVSQCVFGYIELLDENSLPSETATVKFLQDHMQNDRKRLKIIRDTRRCFAKLVTAENDDACEVSKSLAKCLQLNIE